MFEEYLEIKKEMELVYLHDKRPWMIGYSGGKYLNTMAVSVVEGGTGIDAVNVDLAPIYFDLTGKQIVAPVRGLYIKKVGDKITKEFVR